jgi:hypothetical protein
MTRRVKHYIVCDEKKCKAPGQKRTWDRNSAEASVEEATRAGWHLSPSGDRCPVCIVRLAWKKEKEMRMRNVREEFGHV